MSLYVSEKVGNEIVLKKYAPAVPVYRGFWAVTIGGFAGTLVECNGSMRYIGSNEKTIYQIVEPGTYTFTATRHGETKSKTIVLDDKDPNNSYTVNLGLYIGMQYLEYIESTGTQYIDTGVVPHEGYSADLTFQFRDLTTPSGISPNTQICGVRQNGDSNRFYPIAVMNDTQIRTTYGNAQVIYSVDSLSKHTVNLNKNDHIYLDGTDYGSCANSYVEPSDSQYTMYLFKWNYGESGPSDPVCKMRIYEYKMYDNNGNLVSDFAPIKDDTGHGALYDKVTQQIFYNSGEGEFICGPNKPYTRIQYLESTTCEQYIDTGIIPTSDMTYYGKFGFVEFISSQNILQVFGSRNISGTPNGIYASIRNTGIGLDFFDTNRYELSTSVTRDDVFDFAIENHISTIKKNGTVVGTYTFSTTTDTTDYPLHLNALISGGVVDNIKGTSRIYSFKVLNHGTLIRDMIPILDNEGTPCLLDKVEDRLYYNSGIGEFIPGPAYVELEYIESTGTQYIDTGVKFTGTTSKIDARYKLNSTGVTGSYSSLSATQIDDNTRWGSLQYDKTVGKCTFTVGNVPGGSGIIFSPSGSIDHVIYTTNGTSLTVEFNNNTQTLSAGGSALTGQTLYLGCKNTSGTRSEYFVGNIYSYKLEIDGTLVRDFIPVKMGTEVGMYDTVTDTFFTNAGTGELIAGPEKQ